MNTTNAVVLSGVIVAVGHWANDRKLNIGIAVGAGVLAFILAAMNESRPDIASKFALMILFSAMLIYLPGIARKLGYSR